jgi:hypothetical protein
MAHPKIQNFKKIGANKEAFLTIFNDGVLQPHLEEFFNKKTLYMDLMQGRL